MGDKTRVDVAILGAPDVAQPAHIHTGSCAKLNPSRRIPTTVQDGVSSTVVDVPMSKLIGGGFAVNVHKSTMDIPTYVSCVDLGKK